MDSCAFSFLSSTYSLRNGTRLLRGIATSNDTSRLHFRVPGFKRTRFQHLVDQTRITNSKRCRSPTVATTGNSDLKNYSTPSKQVNIAFLVSGSGRSLQNFCEKLSTGELKKCNVSLVIASKSSAGAIQRAGSFGIPSRIVSPKDFAGNAEAFCEKISELLDKFEVQLVVMAGWMHFYQIPPRYFGRVINIHPSLIPSFCGQGYYGKRVHEAVVKFGAKVSGCTVHFADNEYDHGPIILQKTVPVFDTDDADDLAIRVFDTEKEALPQAVQLFADGRLSIKSGVVRISSE